ncbi:DUF4424 family protein [Conchiformibius steedae]|uniref:DUF4424 family protein n=1 Tax=Conchiformibius steedae TaxID=153493 RepID=UPI0026E9C413|nr:DUF4424 family protein [Conchiformibius steedae]
MPYKILFAILLTLNILPAAANDSSGFVGTGGVQYLKNKHIDMQSEDLFISKKQIRVAYRFFNHSRNDIRETVLFPLPMVDGFGEGDFADTPALIKSFTIEANGKRIQPKIHVRSYLYPSDAEGNVLYDSKPTDVTTALKSCGFTDSELMDPWTFKHDKDTLAQKTVGCKDPVIQRITAGQSSRVFPAAQVVYSWEQNFKARSTTEIKHRYTPLVGGAVYFDPSPQKEFAKPYCISPTFRQQFQQRKGIAAHDALSYILTTGANWARPIGQFRLTIEHDAKEMVSLCWDGPIKAVNRTQLVAEKTRFLPKRDLDIIFVPTEK